MFEKALQIVRSTVVIYLTATSVIVQCSSASLRQRAIHGDRHASGPGVPTTDHLIFQGPPFFSSTGHWGVYIFMGDSEMICWLC